MRISAFSCPRGVAGEGCGQTLELEVATGAESSVAGAVGSTAGGAATAGVAVALGGEGAVAGELGLGAVAVGADALGTGVALALDGGEVTGAGWPLGAAGPDTSTSFCVPWFA